MTRTSRGEARDILSPAAPPARAVRPSASQQRVLAVLPVAFIGWASTNHVHVTELLWLCNMSNLVLALGLVTDRPRLIWLATAWLVLGMPFWLLDVFVSHEFFWHAPFTHVVAPALGILVMRGRPPQPRTWMLAVAFGVALQAGCRWWTPQALNINISHTQYRGLSGWLDSSYMLYWLPTWVAIGVALFAIERLLTRWVAAPIEVASS